MLQCDRKQECGQCRRAGLQCPGPRDSNELVFRDQSQEVSRKVTTKSSRSIIPKSIIATILEQAKALFFNRYVNGNARTYDYIASFIPRTDWVSCLPAAVDAASLAYFSAQNSSRVVLKYARENYVLALRLVGEALQSRDQATKDPTLVSVLLLDLFEKLTRTHRSSDSWTKHMKGAIELVKLRGDAQFRSVLGLRLFLQFHSTLLIGCLQHNARVPCHLIELRREASQYIDSKDPKWNFSEIVLRFVELRAETRKGRFKSKELLDTARRLDAELKVVAETVPPEWKYNIVMVPSPVEEIYGEYFHVYMDHHMTHTLNNIRIIRILLNELIREHYLSQADPAELSSIFSPESHDDDYAHVSDCILTLSTEIVASVPQYTQLPRHVNGSMSEPSSIERSTHYPLIPRKNPLSHLPRISSSNSIQAKVKLGPQDFTLFETSRCYSLVFPLYVVGSSEVCSDSMQEWILTTLAFLKNIVGIKEAAVAAGYLKGREKINPWSLYAMIGSYSFSA
jgi:hypothetical protein